MGYDVGTGIAFVCVGIVLAVVASICAYFMQKYFTGIINIWANWRTLPGILFFYVGSTVLIILGIYVIVHSETHSKHASIGTGVEQCLGQRTFDAEVRIHPRAS